MPERPESGVEIVLPCASVVSGSDAEISALLDAFLGGKSDRTVESYREDLKSFAVHLQATEERVALSRLFSLSGGEANRLVVGYRNALVRERLSPATINRRLSSLRSLSRLARLFEVVSWTLEVPGLRSTPYRDTKGPGREVMLQVIGALSRSDRPQDIRDLSICRLMYDLGLRRGEVAELDVGDVDVPGRRISIMGKGRREREWLTLPDSTLSALIRWISVLSETDGPLFRNFDSGGKASSGKRLTGRGLYHIVTGLGRRIAGVRMRPHGIRHTSITEAVKIAASKGLSLDHVLDFSRHANVQTIMRYSDRLRDSGGKIAAWVSESASGADLPEM